MVLGGFSCGGRGRGRVVLEEGVLHLHLARLKKEEFEKTVWCDYKARHKFIIFRVC